MYYVLYMIVLYIIIYIVVLYQSPRLSDCIDWQAFRRVNSIFLSGRIGPVWPYLRKAYQLQEEVADMQRQIKYCRRSESHFLTLQLNQTKQLAY